jgi:hypothetical protein
VPKNTESLWPLSDKHGDPCITKKKGDYSKAITSGKKKMENKLPRKQPKSVCKPNTTLGVPGKGIHGPRVPGTDCAAADYLLTIILAWIIAAKFKNKVSLVNVTIALFSASTVLHQVFCIKPTN